MSSKRDPTKIPLVKDTAHENKKAFWYKNQGKYVYIFCARPFKELEEEEEGEIVFLQFHVCHCSSVFYHLCESYHV